VSSDDVIFHTDGLCEGRVGDGVFSNTLNIKESHALGSLGLLKSGIFNSRLF
jgi:hypothetical protein